MLSKAAYRELYRNSCHRRAAFKEHLPGSKWLHRMTWRSKARAWIGTWWPWAAAAIARAEHSAWARKRFTCHSCGARSRNDTAEFLDSGGGPFCAPCYRGMAVGEKLEALLRRIFDEADGEDAGDA